MSRKALGLMLVAVTFLVLLVAEPLPVHAASGIVQQNNGGCGPNGTACSSTTLAVAFPGNVHHGSVLVVGVQGEESNPVQLISDSLGLTFSQAVTRGDGFDHVYIYDATYIGSGAPDTVTVTFLNTQGGQNVYIYEVAGVTTTGATTSSDAASSGTSIDAGSVTFTAGAFLLGMIATAGAYNGPKTVTQGAGFTLSPDNSATGISHAQYATSGVPPPTTTFPATQSAGSNTEWVEAGLALNPIPEAVGGRVVSIDTLLVLMPWLILTSTLSAAVVGAFMMRRRMHRN